MIKVQVESATFEVKSGIAAKTGKPYNIREQEAWAFCYGRDGTPYPHPQKIKLTLGDDQAPYPVGAYTLDPASLYVDKFSQLAVRAALNRAVEVAESASGPRSTARAA